MRFHTLSKLDCQETDHCISNKDCEVSFLEANKNKDAQALSNIISWDSFKRNIGFKMHLK